MYTKCILFSWVLLLVFFLKPISSLFNMHCFVGKTLLRDNSKVLLQFEEGIEFTCHHRMINNNSNVDVEKFKLNLKMNISTATAQRKTIIARLELNRTALQSLIMSYQVKLNKSQLLTGEGGHHNDQEKEGYVHDDDAGTSFHLRSYICEIYLPKTTPRNNEKAEITVLKFGLVALPSNYTNANNSACRDQQFSPFDDNDYLRHRGPCDSDVVYLLPKNISKCNDIVSFLYIHINNQTVPIFQLIFNDPTYHQNTSAVTNLVVLRHHVFLVLDGVRLLKGTFTKPGIVSLVYLSKFQEKVHLMTGTLHCPLINLPADFFETVLILQSNESHAIISIYTHPFDLAQGSVGVGNSVLNASHAVDLKYDYGRRQIVVLFDDGQELTVRTFFPSGVSRCSSARLQNDIQEAKLMVRSNAMFLIDKIVTKVWTSPDGGCSWRKLKRFPTEIPRHFQSYSPSILLFHNLHKPHTGSLHDISSPTTEIFWTKFGFARPGTLNGTSVYSFVLNKPIPDSNNPFINQQGVLLDKSDPDEEIFTFKFIWGNTSVPETWLKSTLVFGNSPCTVDGVSDSNLTLSCSHTSFHALNQHFEKGRWYNKNFYHSNTISCTPIYTVNSAILTLLQEELSRVDHVMFTNPFRQVQVLEFDGMHLSLGNGSSDLHISPGGDVCLKEGFLNIQDFILQAPDQCSMSFSVTGLSDMLIYLDVGDHVEIEAVFQIDSMDMINSKISSLEWLKVQFLQPDIVLVRSAYEKSKRLEEVTIFIQQFWAYETVNLLTIAPTIQNLACDFEQKEIQILNACPPDKKMLFDYPYSINADDLFASNDVRDRNGILRVFYLPTNYQPPSSYGIGIPQTSHVYNADPSQPLLYPKYLEEQTKPVYKQCRGMKNRTMCKCSPSIGKSLRIENSDCISRVYRIIYPERLVLSFLLHRNQNTVSFGEPLTLTEHNGRVDYSLSGSVKTADGQDVINSVTNSSVELKGSGLYHFSVDTLQKNVTYCNFQIDFIVYMDETPLASSFSDVIMACTTFVFGFILLGLFLFQYYRTPH